MTAMVDLYQTQSDFKSLIVFEAFPKNWDPYTALK